MYLVIAEKPSVARSIAQVIGANERKEGYLEGDDCIVSWCLGHLAGYAYPERYDERYKNWNFEDLPIIPTSWKVEVSKDKKDQFYILKQLLNQPGMDYVINACDAGREGELIFKHVYDLSRSRLPVKRLWISSLEDSAILDGFEHLKDGEEYRNLANAAVCRSQADWLIGMNSTRAFTSKYYKRLTVGRVQTPTLAMLVERDNQIKNFKKQKYFNVELDCDGMKAVREKIFDEREADQLLCKCDGKDASVVSLSEKEKRVKPPRLYDLTSLQRDANRIYGMTAKQTLDAAQSLYEAKLITYPRTDSQYLTEDMESTGKSVVRRIHEVYQVLGPFEEPTKPDMKKVMNNAKVSDHHAIIPTMDPEMFLRGICNLLSMILNGLEELPPEETTRFSNHKSIGNCPICGSPVFEGKKNFYCSNRECRFSLWKENRYLETMKKTIDTATAVALLAHGRAHMKDLYSRKKDMYFEADLLVEFKDGRANFSLEFPKNSNSKTKK